MAIGPLVVSTQKNFRFCDDDGLPVVGGRVYVFHRDTTDPVDLFMDKKCTLRNAFPVILDTHGEANIFLDTKIPIDIRIENAHGLLVFGHTEVAIFRCPKCGADRLKEPCGRPNELMSCPMIGTAAARKA